MEDERVSDLVERFVDAHFEAHPEEASSLGRRDYAARLSAPSASSSATEVVGLRAALVEADAIEASREVPLHLDAALDLDALRRAARFHLRRLERDRDAELLEPATLPGCALQHSLLHARTREDLEALAARAAAVPEALAARTRDLRRGVAEGRGPDRDVATTFVERILPGAAAALDTMAAEVVRRFAVRDIEVTDVVARIAQSTREASAAYRQMAAFVADEIVPRARLDVTLGREEVDFRLREVMGVETSIEVLRVRAEERLARAHGEVIEHARATGRGDVRTASDARAAVTELFGPKPPTLEAALAHYQTQIEASTRLARSFVPIPDDLALDLEPLPDGIADGSALTNWPAPLLDPKGRGHALYARDPAMHPSIMAKQLAVHECIPGHYLQSVVWQRARPSVVRFLGVQDDIAMAHGYFGAMVSVEGWAVHMEGLMVREGFMDAGNERLFAAWCDAVRAVRVLLDLGLHAEGRSADEMVARVAEATFLPEGWARQQVLRSKRIPLQSSTYLIGAMEIEALTAKAPTTTRELEVHRRLLSVGPVPTSRLGRLFD